jgi:hypothetical protein
MVSRTDVALHLLGTESVDLFVAQFPRKVSGLFM